MQLLPVEARTLDDFESAFAMLLREHAEGLMVVSGGSFAGGSAQQRRLVDLAMLARLPTISSIREDVEAGMLMSYGESYKEFNRRSAFYVDKIIRGAKPADLPVQQPNHRWSHSRGAPSSRGTLFDFRLEKTSVSWEVFFCFTSQVRESIRSTPYLDFKWSLRLEHRRIFARSVIRLVPRRSRFRIRADPEPTFKRACVAFAGQRV
jgi:hypothetical protein